MSDETSEDADELIVLWNGRPFNVAVPSEKTGVTC